MGPSAQPLPLLLPSTTSPSPSPSPSPSARLFRRAETQTSVALPAVPSSSFSSSLEGPSVSQDPFRILQRSNCTQAHRPCSLVRKGAITTTTTTTTTTADLCRRHPPRANRRSASTLLRRLVGTGKSGSAGGTVPSRSRPGLLAVPRRSHRLLLILLRRWGVALAMLVSSSIRPATGLRSFASGCTATYAPAIMGPMTRRTGRQRHRSRPNDPGWRCRDAAASAPVAATARLLASSAPPSSLACAGHRRHRRRRLFAPNPLGSSVRSDVLAAANSTASTAPAGAADAEGSEGRLVLDDAFDDDDEDTIYALSSGSSPGATAVAVVRITGPRVVSAVLPGLLRSPRAVDRVTSQPRVAHLCTLYEPPPPGSSILQESQNARNALDRAVVLYFPKPRSFTGQDVLELHLHGSRAVVSDVLGALEGLGPRTGDGRGGGPTVRMAEPGEFTQRAHRSGKLDVLQTEALADLLHSDTSQQRRQALRQLDGSLSKIYQRWRDELIAGLAHAEAVIDFGDDEHLSDDDDGDEDEENVVRGMSVWGNVGDRMEALRVAMQRQLADERRGELVREGVKIVVAGPPNAGKSTLFNVLAQRDAAIVSPHAGTTRDVLEVQLNLSGIKCRVQDTAGVRSGTCDDVERIGIDRAVRAVRTADVVVAMLDATDVESGVPVLRSIVDGQTMAAADDDDGADGDDDEAIEPPRKSPMLLVLNKADLVQGRSQPDASKVSNVAPNTSFASLLARHGLDRHVREVFEVSCVTQEGLDDFLSSLASTVARRVSGGDDSDPTAPPGSSSSSFSGSTPVLITRARHRQHIAATVACLDRFRSLARLGAPVMDLAAEELRLAASELGRVTGAVDVEDVLDKLFSDFCIGK